MISVPSVSMDALCFAMDLGPEDLTVDEICRHHGLSQGFVRREIKDGRLPALRFGSSDRGPLRITREAYIGWIESCRVDPKPKGSW